MTQMEVAARLQLLGIRIDRSVIARLESGKRRASDIEVAAIAKVLEVPISWFFGDSDDLFSSVGAQSDSVIII